MNNVTRSEHHIDFNPDYPTIYYGWYFSGADDQMAVHPFVHGEERERFIGLVGEAMNDPAREREDHERAAAFLAFRNWGDHPDDQDWGERLLREEFPDYAAALERIEYNLGQGFPPRDPVPEGSVPSPNTRPYTVEVQWMAEASVVVHAHDAEEADGIVRRRGLPWDRAGEGADGALTVFNVVEPEAERLDVRLKEALRRLGAGERGLAVESAPPPEIAGLARRAAARGR